MVAIVTTASYSIGSFASGMFAVFPIVMGCSIVILHPRVGGVASASMLAHAQIALNGLWLGFLAVHYLVAPLGVWGPMRSGCWCASPGAACLWLIRAWPRKQRHERQSFLTFANCALSA